MAAVEFVWPLWERNLATIIKNRKISTPSDPAIPLLGIYPEAIVKNMKAMCKETFTAVMFIIVKHWEPPKGPQQGKDSVNCGSL